MLERNKWDLRFYRPRLALDLIEREYLEACCAAIRHPDNLSLEFVVSPVLFEGLASQFVDDLEDRARVIALGTFYQEVSGGAAERSWCVRVTFVAKGVEEAEHDA